MSTATRKLQKLGDSMEGRLGLWAITAAQRAGLGSLTAGQMVYDTDHDAFFYVDTSGAWIKLGGAAVNFVISGQYIYFGGKTGPGNNIERFNTATDTTNAVDLCDLSQARISASAAASYTKVYFFGGTISSESSPIGAGETSNVIDAILKADDSVDAVDKANLSAERTRTAAENSLTTAYIFGGAVVGDADPDTGNNLIDGFVFATDTTNATDKANLANAAAALTAISTDADAIYVGGGEASAADVNYIQRFDTTADTSDATDKADLSVARRLLAGCQSATLGYFCGGNTGAGSDVVDSFDPAADTTNAVDKCNLTSAKYYCGAENSTTHGYIGPGTGSGNDGTEIEAIVFAADTTNAVDKADTTQDMAGSAVGA